MNINSQDSYVVRSKKGKSCLPSAKVAKLLKDGVLPKDQPIISVDGGKTFQTAQALFSDSRKKGEPPSLSKVEKKVEEKPRGENKPMLPSNPYDQKETGLRRMMFVIVCLLFVTFFTPLFYAQGWAMIETPRLSRDSFGNRPSDYNRSPKENWMVFGWSTSSGILTFLISLLIGGGLVLEFWRIIPEGMSGFLKYVYLGLWGLLLVVNLLIGLTTMFFGFGLTVPNLQIYHAKLFEYNQRISNPELMASIEQTAEALPIMLLVVLGLSVYGLILAFKLCRHTGSEIKLSA